MSFGEVPGFCFVLLLLFAWISLEYVQQKAAIGGCLQQIGTVTLYVTSVGQNSARRRTVVMSVFRGPLVDLKFLLNPGPSVGAIGTIRAVRERVLPLLPSVPYPPPLRQVVQSGWLLVR